MTTIGFIYSTQKPTKEDEIFMKVAKEKKIEIVPFNMDEELKEDVIREKLSKCDLVFNNSADPIAIEFAKTAEALGKKTVDSTERTYYMEDKWIFYIKCREHGIPVPKTTLLSENLNSIRNELKNFNCWPVILKRVVGEQGQYVERAENADEAINIIKKFWDNDERIPIIAQEFIKSDAFRVTVVGGKILQGAIKNAPGWKATAVYSKKLESFPIDEKLEKLINKLMKFVKIDVCGIDFLKKDDEWVVLEVNAQPSLEFLDEETEKVVGIVLDFLKASV